MTFSMECCARYIILCATLHNNEHFVKIIPNSVLLTVASTVQTGEFRSCSLSSVLALVWYMCTVQLRKLVGGEN